jgi:hypothetical protein
VNGSEPFAIRAGWPQYLLAYSLLWALLVAMIEAGAADLSAALAMLIAGGATVALAERAVANLGLLKGGT